MKMTTEEILLRAQLAATLATAPGIELTMADGDTWVVLLLQPRQAGGPMAGEYSTQIMRAEGRTPERALVAMAHSLIDNAFGWAIDNRR